MDVETSGSVDFLEELSLNAWPSLKTLLYDGWALRFADGYTRRANSVNILHPSRMDILGKIGHCEELYESNGLDTIFKLTTASSPETLDNTLAELGYRLEAPTSVMVVDLADIQGPISDNVLIDDRPTDEWITSFCRLSDLDPRNIPVMAQMLNSIVPARGFFSYRADQQTVAQGLAVIERGYVGLFDIVVARQVRNQGISTQLLANMLRWGKANNADHAYLGVMHSNAPALHAYSKLGFREAYSYWYRVKRRT